MSSTDETNSSTDESNDDHDKFQDTCFNCKSKYPLTKKKWKILTGYTVMHVIIGFMSFVFPETNLAICLLMQIVLSEKDVLVKYAFFLLTFPRKFIATSTFLFP